MVTGWWFAGVVIVVAILATRDAYRRGCRDTERRTSERIRAMVDRWKDSKP